MAFELKGIERLEARAAIEELNTNFCHYLDHGDIEALASLFTESARYSHGTRVSLGREEILRLFKVRQEKCDRTARHMQTSLKIEFLSENSAQGTSVCMTFAADAKPPISPATPYLVADFLDEYLRGQDGVWRICERHIERIFVDSSNEGPVGL